MTIFGSLRCQILQKRVYSILSNSQYFNHVRRLGTNKVSDIFYVEELTNRGLLQVCGNEISQFMQGLITNDMRHLEEGSRSMYAMFLNSKGRVMYDTIIYRDLKNPCIYIECDKSAINDLQKHLQMFKIRRNVDIKKVNNLKIWAVFSPKFIQEINTDDKVVVTDVSSQEKVVPCQATNFNNAVEYENTIFAMFSNDNFLVTWDPRLPTLGLRILASDSVDVEKIAKDKGLTIEKSKLSYKAFRYNLGIAEGTDELPLGKCFPLEMNCDYLHGVSFHKGCYIGQELTARTHHTGVVRKRLMPIYLESSTDNTNKFNSDTPVEVSGESSRSVGKLRGIEDNIAIGVIRITEALNAAKLKIGNLTGYTKKPHWWPQEAPKESLLSRKE